MAHKALLAGVGLLLATVPLAQGETGHASGGDSGVPSALVQPNASALGSGCIVGGASLTPAPGAGLLSGLTPPTIESGLHPYAVAVAPGGEDVYVADYGSEQVSQYSRDPTTGELTPMLPATVPAGVEPHSVAVSADGRNAYVANSGSNTVSEYARDPNSGALSPLSPAAVQTGAIPRSVAISPDGRNVYVANTGENEGGEEAVSQYRRNPATGTLTLLSPASVSGGLHPRFVAISPDGRNVYVAAYGSTAVFGFVRNLATGALTGRVGYALPARPYSISISPDGHSLYVADYSSGGISQFARNPASGRLRGLNPLTVTAGEETHSVVVSPDGANAYATNATPLGTVSQYSRNPRTGALAPIGSGAMEVGTEPTAIALDPTGNSAYITNHRSASISEYARATSDESPVGLLLTRMSVQGDRVLLKGVSAPSLIGRRVTIVLAGHRVVGSTLVVAGARFSAIVGLPRLATGAVNLTVSFQAQIGGLHSAEASLGRRLRLLSPVSSDGQVRLSGRVVPPFAAAIAAVRIWQRVGCNAAVAVASVRPNAHGYFALAVANPTVSRVAIYSATTTFSTSHDHKRVQAQSLEQPVQLH